MKQTKGGLRMAMTLRAARVNAGLTQSEVGDILGRQAATVSAWETGANRISADDFVALCRLYQVSSDDIILPKISS